MKIQNLVAVAAIGLTASTAFAQSHPSAPGIASSTVSGIFVPAPSTSTLVSRTGGVIVTAPASTPVSVFPVRGATASYQAAAATVNSVTAGSPAAVASFTQSLGASGVPAAAAQGLATALQQISSSPTVGSIVTAIATWNAAIATLSPAQVRALVRTPQGYQAARAISNAYSGARLAR